MKACFADLRYALRLYVRTPGSSFLVVVVLAIGMAFVGAFLSLYVDLVLRPHHGFEQGGRIATLGQDDGTFLVGLPFDLVERMSNEMTSIEAAAGLSSTMALVGPEREESAAVMVSNGFFGGIQPRLALGSGFRPKDHATDAEPVVVLSYRYWQQRYNGDRNVLGTFLEIERDPNRAYRGPNFLTRAEPEQEWARFRIVGVMTQALTTISSFEPEVWLPLERAYSMFVGVPETLARQTVSVIVRRAQSARDTAVASEFRARYGSPEAFPNRIPGAELDAIDGVVSNITVQREAKRQLELFLAGSVLLALVAAANVSLFLLMRAPSRRRELGVRTAVGAPLGRLKRQLVTEAGLLVIVAAVPALLVNVWLSRYLRGLPLLRDAEWHDVTLLDWRVLSLVGALLLALALLVSLAPVLGLKRLGISASSRHATARASLAQRVMGTAQIAIAGTLGGAAVAFGWYLGILILGDPGYETASRYMVDGVSGPQPDMPEGYIVELDRRRSVIEALPGVMAVGFGSTVPGGDRARNVVLSPTTIPDPRDPADQIDVYRGSLDRSFVEILGFGLVEGRVPEAAEPAVVIVNQTLAQMVWGRDDVVGERLPGTVYWGSGGAEVVGVLEDLSFDHPSAAAKPFVFSAVGGGALLTTVIQAQLSAADLKQALDNLVADGELEVDVGNVHAISVLRNDLIASDRARGYLTILAAALVVISAALSFYGTHRYLVSAGRREYAIRAALGAGPAALRRLVLWRGLLLGLPGIVAGSLLAFVIVAWLRNDFLSPQIMPSSVSLAVVCGLVVILLLASVGPAQRARRTKPALLLREES